MTLTVKPSGEMTTIKSFLPPDANTRYNGIKVVGRGTLAVKLEGKVRIVNEAGDWTSPTEATFDNGGTEETATFIAPQYRRGSQNFGVFVQNDRAGNVNREDKIEVVIGAETRIGTEDVPVGRTGVFAYYSSSSAEGAVSIVNRGEIYGYYRGIQVLNQGSGDIAVETAKGSVTSKGVVVHLSKGGDITVTNHGTIRSLRQRPLYAKTLSGGKATLYNDDLSLFNSDGIIVNHTDTTEGAADNPSSTIMITSSGDIDARRSGIHIDTRGDDDSVVPVAVKVTGGTIKAEDLHGIDVYSNHAGGDIEIDLAGVIAQAGGHGVYVRNQVTEGTTRVAVVSGARIGTAETPVGESGVFVETEDADNEIDLMVTNEGLIHAKGSGVVALHISQGDVVAKHLAGEIVAGDQPNAFSALTEDHQTELAGLKPRTAGILAIHGGSEPQAASDETAVDSQAPSTYEAKIGKIEITSKADITSKGDGILAYVKDLEDTAGIRDIETIIPIMIDVAGGTIMADGHGVHAETATVYEDEDAPKAGKIEVTVGEMATIRAKKDGVHVKGKRTFVASHARAGQYDQTVTINGKVMGGAGERAGVRMVNGGTLVIGPKAKVEAASGTAVKSDGGLTITMKKDAVGRIGYVKGKMLNSGTTTFDGVKVGGEYTLSPGLETRGVYDVSRVTLKMIEGGHQFEESGRAYHARARVYEALPSVLLEMSAPGGRQARLSATRDGGGVWARVMASDGEREADMSTTAMDTAGHDLSWDFERWGVETGLVVPTDAPGLTLGASAHYRDGEADVARGGKIEVSGVGVGASATWRGEDGWYADGELSYTRFEDIDLSSEARGMVASGLDGEGHAIGVEVGRRMEMDGFALVPRGGLTWTWVDVDGFADVSGVTGSGRVSFRSEDSVRARIGALLENGQTYASLDVERELSESREAMASGSRLRSEAESTWARLGVGGVMVLNEKGESTLSGDAHYVASDGDNHDYGASVLLKVRF